MHQISRTIRLSLASLSIFLSSDVTYFLFLGPQMSTTITENHTCIILMNKYGQKNAYFTSGTQPQRSRMKGYIPLLSASAFTNLLFGGKKILVISVLKKVCSFDKQKVQIVLWYEELVQPSAVFLPTSHMIAMNQREERDKVPCLFNYLRTSQR